MRLALVEAASRVVLTVLALTVANGGARPGMLVGGLVLLGGAFLHFAVHWHFRGRTRRVDAREHYFGRKGRSPD